MALPVPHRDEPVASYDERTKSVSVNDNWHRFFEQISSTFSTMFGSGSASALGTAAYKNTGTSGDAVPLLNVASAWSGQQYFAVQSLTDGASIAWNLDTQQVANVTLGGARTLANPTNMKAGGTYQIIVTAAGNTLAYGSAYKWPGGTVPVVTGTTILTFLSDGTSMFGVAAVDFS